MPSTWRNRHSDLRHQAIQCTSATLWPRYLRVIGVGGGASHRKLVMGRDRGIVMANIVNEFLLFSCLAAFVAGIVVAAASLLI